MGCCLHWRQVQSQRNLTERRMLRCANCKQTKDVDDFSRSCKSKSGRHSYCRACDAAYYAQTRGKVVPSAVPTVGEANTTEADHLYLLRYPWENSPINVGHAKNVTTRVHSLESGHNVKIQVLTIFPGQGRLERKVHALLSEHRAADGRCHEWFTVTLQQALPTVALAIASCVHYGPPADLA